MHTILVTGGAGFIGSNFIPYFIENNPNYHIINLDLLTYAGDLINVSEVENHPRYTFVQGDICDRNFIEELFQKYQFHDVIHFAAESHVDRSIQSGIPLSSQMFWVCKFYSRCRQNTIAADLFKSRPMRFMDL